MNFSYWFKNWSLNYKICYAIVSVGIKTFYKKYEVEGLENIPKDAGILFAINHQNAFMDPVVLSFQLNKNAYYLARADIFKKKLASKILKSIYILPIFRQRDGVNTIVKNEATFNQCHDILNNNGYVQIFPEGNHNNQKKLRPIKKGIARIGFGAAEKSSFLKPYYIVPVGLDYSNHTKMGASLLINISKPINLADYYSKYKTDIPGTINKLMAEVKTKMESLIVNIKSENYTTFTNIIWVLNDEINSNSLKTRLINQQSLVSTIETIETNNKPLFDVIQEQSNFVYSYLKTNNIRPVHLYKKNSITKAFVSLFILTISLPIHIFGLLSNYLPYKIPESLVKNKIKDEHFHSSIKMSLGVILFLLFWTMQSLLVLGLFGLKIGLLYIISLPILAMFNYRWMIFLKKTKGLTNAIRRCKSTKHQQAKRNYALLKNELIKKGY
jgi:1-acyl-sn-glycerol-3-phosphate acyltransferase